jgi:hypothetical protein
MSSPSHCLVLIGGYTFRHTDCLDKFGKHAIEMGSSAMIYILSFIKVGSGIQMLMIGVYRHWTHRENGNHKSLPIFFQNKESRLISA